MKTKPSIKPNNGFIIVYAIALLAVATMGIFWVTQITHAFASNAKHSHHSYQNTNIALSIEAWRKVNTHLPPDQLKADLNDQMLQLKESVHRN